MIIRLARLDEHEAVRDLVRTAYAKWVPILGREPLPMTADYHVLVSGGHVHVLTEGDDLCAVLVLLVEDGYVMVENIAVHPNWQRHGFGDHLLAFAESFTKQQHRDEIRLYTNVLMTTNINYYLKHGYHETHRETTPAYTRVFMSKTLAT